MYHANIVKKFGISSYSPGDSNYDEKLKEKINQSIAHIQIIEEKNRISELKNSLTEIISKEKNPTLLLEEPWLNYLFTYPELLEEEIIENAVKELLYSTITKKDKIKKLKSIYDLALKMNKMDKMDKMDICKKITEELYHRILTDPINKNLCRSVFYLNLARQFNMEEEVKPIIEKSVINDSNKLNTPKTILYSVSTLEDNKLLNTKAAKNYFEIIKKIVDQSKDAPVLLDTIKILEKYDINISLEEKKEMVRYIVNEENIIYRFNNGQIFDFSELYQNDNMFFEFLINKIKLDSIINDDHLFHFKEYLTTSIHTGLKNHFTPWHKRKINDVFVPSITKYIMKKIKYNLQEHKTNGELNTFKEINAQIEKIKDFLYDDTIYTAIKMELNRNIYSFPRSAILLENIEIHRKALLKPSDDTRLDESKLDSEDYESITSVYAYRRRLETLSENKCLTPSLAKDIIYLSYTLLNESLSFYSIEEFFRCIKLVNQCADTVLLGNEINIFKKILSKLDREIIISDSTFLQETAALYQNDMEVFELVLKKIKLNPEMAFNHWEKVFHQYLGIHFTDLHKSLLEKRCKEEITSSVRSLSTTFFDTNDELQDKCIRYICYADRFILDDTIYQLFQEKFNALKLPKKMKQTVMSTLKRHKALQMKKAKRMEPKDSKPMSKSALQNIGVFGTTLTKTGSDLGEGVSMAHTSPSPDSCSPI
jgi:hypothetical protein